MSQGPSATSKEKGDGPSIAAEVPDVAAADVADKAGDEPTEEAHVVSSDSEDDHILDARLLEEELQLREEREAEAEERQRTPAKAPAAPPSASSGFEKLDRLLLKSRQFTEFLAERLAEARALAESSGLEGLARGAASPAGVATTSEPEGAEVGAKRKKGAGRLGSVKKGPGAGAGADAKGKGKGASTRGVDMGDAAMQRVLQRQLCPRVTGGELKDYQLKGVAWLASLHLNGLNGILADQMGLGKTCQSISFLSTLYWEMGGGPFIIVGPLSTLPNWINEIKRWTPDMPCVLYHGKPEERREIRETQMTLTAKGRARVGFPIVVTSFEVCMRDRAALAKYPWKYMIVDEGHRLKNKDCKLLRDLSEIAAARDRSEGEAAGQFSGSSCGRLLLTGTPLQNNLLELFSLLRFIMPAVFEDVDEFNRWFDVEQIVSGTGPADEGAGDRPKSTSIVERLQDVLRPFLLRRVKTDVLSSLPAKKEIVLYAAMTPAQKSMVEGIKDRSLDKEIDALRRLGPSLARTTLNNRLMQLRKASNHPDLITSQIENSAMFPLPEALRAQCGKLQLLDRLLEGLLPKGHKVLIFSQMARMLDLLDYYLAEQGIECRKLDGSVAWSDRQRSIDEFNADPSVQVFLLTTRAGGLGINLTAADTVIIYDSDWNPHMDFQAMDRCHRIGQTVPVLVFRLVTQHSVEVKMLERANSKLKLERLVVKKQDVKLLDEKKKPGVQEAEDFYADAQPTKLTDEELAELLQADYTNDDECQAAPVDAATLAALLDREHMRAKAAAPYEKRGVGYMVVERENAGLLQSVE